jgi:hypothetical protein
MLRFEDRIRIALGNGIGCPLDYEDVTSVGNLLVALHKIANGQSGATAKIIASDALRFLERER